MKRALILLTAMAALGGCADFDRMGHPATDYTGPDKPATPPPCPRRADPPKDAPPSTPSPSEKDASETCRGLGK